MDKKVDQIRHVWQNELKIQNTRGFSMLQLLRSLILDFQQTEHACGVRRRIEHTALPQKASVYMGVRRAGKSTFLLQIIQEYLKNGVPKENILALNFFDERLSLLHAESLQSILDAYFSLYPHKKNTEKIYCFFDEIQCVEGFEPFIDRIMRQENCAVYLTGSSSKMLSKEIATQMRGRSLSWEIFPFSFHEYLDTKNIDVTSPLSTQTKFFIQNSFEEYMRYGGFPETCTVSDAIRIQIHQEYWNTIIFRDIVERNNIHMTREVFELCRQFINIIGSLYSINKLDATLKSLGYTLTKSYIPEYISCFEDAYIFFSVYIFDASVRKRNANPKKIYCIDHGFVRSISNRILVNSGHILENFIFVCLRRYTNEIYYYKTKSGKEVDFIVQNIQYQSAMFQVAQTLVDENTKKREINAIYEAMNEQNLHCGYIITEYEEDEITIQEKKIFVLPAWKFSLYFDIRPEDFFTGSYTRLFL